MKTIPLSQAIKLLEECSGVIIDDIITYPKICEEDEFFLKIEWDSDGNEFLIIFNKIDNTNVKIINSSMFLVDECGEECQITLLAPMELENISLGGTNTNSGILESGKT